VTEDVRDIDSAGTEPSTEPADEESVTEEPIDDRPDDEADDEVGAETDDEVDAETDDEVDAKPIERRRRALSPRVRKVIAAVLIVLLLISGGVATWLYFDWYRPDQQTDDSVARSVASAASDATTAVLSYSVDSLDQDFAAARSHLGGEFLSYFDQFSQQTVAPMARQKSMKTKAKVTGAAVSELQPDSAAVLVFVDQVTTTKDSAQPSVAVSSILVRMSRINGKWLITKFTPV
jgi:Mce-associated membrane protein